MPGFSIGFFPPSLITIFLLIKLLLYLCKENVTARDTEKKREQSYFYSDSKRVIFASRIVKIITILSKSGSLGILLQVLS